MVLTTASAFSTAELVAAAFFSFKEENIERRKGIAF
jgi:hypothetical protein